MVGKGSSGPWVSVRDPPSAVDRNKRTFADISTHQLVGVFSHVTD